MANIFAKIGHELKGAIVPIVYFFVMFHLIAFTNALLLESYEITPSRAVLATIGAIFAGKAIVVANKLPFLNLFSGKPLVIGVLWRSLVYGFFAALLFANEHVIKSLIEGHGFAGAFEETKNISLRHVAANCIWLSLCMLLYNSFAELDRMLGKGALRKAFLGIGAN